MLIAGVVGLAVGWLRGGKLARLASIDFPLWWLIIIAFLIQSFFSYLVDKVGYGPIFALYLGSFVLIAVALVANGRKKFVPIMIAGIIMNFAVIAANHGMPYYSEPATVNAEEVKTFKGLHIPADSGTILGFLGDWIAIPPPYPQPSILSPGDVVIAFGLFLFIQRSMLGRPGRRRATVRCP